MWELNERNRGKTGDVWKFTAESWFTVWDPPGIYCTCKAHRINAQGQPINNAHSLEAGPGFLCWPSRKCKLWFCHRRSSRFRLLFGTQQPDYHAIGPGHWSKVSWYLFPEIPIGKKGILWEIPIFYVSFLSASHVTMLYTFPHTTLIAYNSSTISPRWAAINQNFNWTPFLLYQWEGFPLRGWGSFNICKCSLDM